MNLADRFRRLFGIEPPRGLAADDPELARAAAVFIRRLAPGYKSELFLKGAEINGVQCGDWKITVEPIDYEAVRRRA